VYSLPSQLHKPMNQEREREREEEGSFNRVRQCARGYRVKPGMTALNVLSSHRDRRIKPGMTR
jgi:hypothetical protein